MARQEKRVRSWFTTITATIIGLGVLGVTLLLLPISSVSEGVTFGIGMLLVVLCAMIAHEGKKGMILELIHTLGFWR